MVFNVVPTIFELALVSTILGVKCGAAFAGMLMVSYLLRLPEKNIFRYICWLCGCIRGFYSSGNSVAYQVPYLHE